MILFILLNLIIKKRSNKPSAEELQKRGIKISQCQANDSSFQNTISSFSPQAVIFDRFFIEEMFGWMFHETVPNCLRVLDSQDLHFLRKTRQILVEKVVFFFP